MRRTLPLLALAAFAIAQAAVLAGCQPAAEEKPVGVTTSPPPGVDKPTDGSTSTMNTGA